MKTTTLSALQRNVKDHVNACFTGLYVVTQEPNEAIKEIAATAAARDWSVATWDIADGLAFVHPNPTPGDRDQDTLKPLHYLQAVEPGSGRSTLVVLPDYHFFLQDPLVIETLRHTIIRGKETRTFVVITAPSVRIPPELEKLFIVIDHDLPAREEIETIMREVSAEEDIPEDPSAVGKLLDAAVGLTHYEAEGAFALSLARHNKLDASVLWNVKASALRKAGTLELYRGNETFGDLGGLTGLKTFCSRALATKSVKARPKGVLLLGVPGGGKSAFAKALGNECGRPTVSIDFGAMFGSLVGETEQQIRRALAAVDAMSPCILFADEIEKGLSGSGSTGDNGVSTRMLGTLLTWLNDHTSDVFFIGTCNDITALSRVSAGAFTRAERFDATFFVDLPTREQRLVIWDMYQRYFEIADDATLKQVEDEGWTGAEIKACCRTAAMLGETLAEAARKIQPISRTAAESIKLLREQSVRNGYLCAERGSVYSERQVIKDPTRTIVRGQN